MKPYENLSLEDMEGEVWKDVVGYEGLYQVSNLGRVKSLDRYVIISDIPRYRKSKIRVQMPSHNGYRRVQVSKEGKTKYFFVHVLVALAFIPNPENKPEIDHINTDRVDNRMENLRWSTRKENASNPLTRQKLSEKEKRKWKEYEYAQRRIEQHHNKREVQQISMTGTVVATYISASYAARLLGVSSRSITACCEGRNQTCLGYFFKYKI